VVAMAAMTLPIALAGLVALPASVPPDVFVLRLPEEAGQHWAVVAALLGGISSAAAMVIVDSTALATMVSNDLIFPAVLRGRAQDEAGGGIGWRMLLVRRIAIVAIIALSLAWALLVSPRSSLASIGLVAFAAMAQFTPHLLMGVFGKGHDPVAGRASLIAGFALWLWTLALPPILPARWLTALADTPLDPARLFGIGHPTPLVHGVLWSLSANLLVLFAAKASLEPRKRLPRLVRAARPVRTQGELAQLVARFVGNERATEIFPAVSQGQAVDRAAARSARDMIAGVVGASSARTLVASALAGGQIGLDDVTRLLDEGGQSLRFSRQLLAATFQNLPSGISVIDGDLKLVAWNSRYIDLFAYPPSMVQAGMPVAELIRHNLAARGGAAAAVEAGVKLRLGRLRARQPYTSERARADGRVIKSVGGPMPGGGYLTSFTDVSEEAATRAELRATLEQLETRVSERTQALSDANRRLAESTREKTRFLAAASHDLLQPLHAARLFASALDRQVDGPAHALVGRVDRSIVAAENLLRALLDISKLDAGGITPNPEVVQLAPLLRDIAEGMRPLAEEKGLRLIVGSLSGAVETDPGLLRSVLQNLVANAVRYTNEGGILIGVRRRGAQLRIDVIDTGVGIPPDQTGAIFAEFTRLGQVEAEGLGLGLAIVERIARLLGLTIDVVSRVGHGSRFSVTIAGTASADEEVAPLRFAVTQHGPKMTVLVVDNDPAIIDASRALLEALGHRVRDASSGSQALLQVDGADVALVDYNLGPDEDGLMIVDAIRASHPRMPIAMITADASPELRQQARGRDIAFFTKPLDPAALEAFLAAASVSQVQP